MPTAGRLRYLEALPSASSRASGRDKRTLVLIHAFPLNAHMWEPQLALADEGWHVVAPHLRGMGGGVGDPPVASMDDCVGDVVDLLDALHIEEAVIGGLSMGGYVTLGVFKHAPRYFSGMILADTKAPADTPEALEGRKKTRAIALEKGRQAVLEGMMTKLLGASSLERSPELAGRLREIVALNSDDSVAGAVTAMMTREDSTPLLSSIHCPTLVIVGDEDVLTPPDLSRQMTAVIARSELVVIPGAGHLSSLEQPDAFNRAVAGFLSHRL